MRREATSNMWMTIVSIVWVAGSCLQSFVALPANGVAQLAIDLAGSMQHAIAVGKEKEGEERRGKRPTGKFKRATLAASQMPKTGRHKLELELGHELDWLAQCVRGDLSTVAAGAKWCRERRPYIVWHAAFAYFVGGRTGSHLSIGSKRCHKGARQRKQSKADTYVNQTRLPPPPPRLPHAHAHPLLLLLVLLLLLCSIGQSASIQIRRVWSRKCRPKAAPIFMPEPIAGALAHLHTHSLAHSVVPTLTHP